MMPGLGRGLIVAALHVAIVSSLGIKLLVDRQTRPRVWARVVPVDPDLPVRGRYVRLRIEGALADGAQAAQSVGVTPVVRDQALVFVPARGRRDGLVARSMPDASGRTAVVLDQPLAFFISEHVRDPSIRASGEELWA